MADELLASVGKYLTIEMVNGKKISGILLEGNLQFIRLQVDKKVATIPYAAVMVVWDGGSSENLTEENMDYIAKQLRSEVEERIVCTSIPGFNCANRYVCVPPDVCTNIFACPGIYTPSQPQGGGCTFGIFQPCTFNFQQPCNFNFSNPCSFNFFQPCGFHFHFRPCGAQFFQPCTFRFQQPCGRPFGCNAPGGFSCPGQAFIGIAPGPFQTQNEKE
ncbi:hypothetical protein [Desulforamulus aeronauticus]|uniref:Uncharacterized protein n=1 Tax=Desulforamulus aeronauticus DSM 10349 TaxID=1121421 RepID=A0A1M6U0P7_9FIRM|nr:hypothetical protein [Desulforamulus aeronauticus]SHK62731.1 hypothetical protein SAMN02745123_02545 [Desulforamulus aeronauticus DSM 10349]